MTIDRDFKKLIRARMAKTGESYSVARANLLRSRGAPRPRNQRLMVPHHLLMGRRMLVLS